jgi:hypothetical protein
MAELPSVEMLPQAFHFSDSGGGADETVGKLSVMRVWWCCMSDCRL